MNTPKFKFTAPGKRWFEIPPQRATFSQFREFQAEARRLADLRAQHAAWVMETRQSS